MPTESRPEPPPLVCPYCGKPAPLRDTSIIYSGRSYGMAYICLGFPECKTYVGVHKATNEPLGTLANQETREARKDAHAAFDPLWQTGIMTRKEAYVELTKRMGISEELCHIGMMTAEECRRVLTAARAIMKGKQL